MQSRVNKILSALTVILVVCCTGRKKNVPTAQPDRAFPTVNIPGAYIDPEERAAYAAAHYWDGFFKGDGPTDSARVLGVPKAEVEQALSNYLAILSSLPLKDAQKDMSFLFDEIAAKQEADTSSRVYLALTDMVSSYLNDPNSPLRDEDLYLPFVQKMAASPLTRDDMRTAFEYEARMCAMNPRGSVAPDFLITTCNGTSIRMHSVKADYSILFFSNPGCHACREIIEALQGDELVQQMIAEGRLLVLNVYIDEDLKAWRDYMPIYPDTWLNGYDPIHVIRNDELYCVRAIPSLYLLDSGKRILLKDAPVEKIQQALAVSQTAEVNP